MMERLLCSLIGGSIAITVFLPPQQFANSLQSRSKYQCLETSLKQPKKLTWNHKILQIARTILSKGKKSDDIAIRNLNIPQDFPIQDNIDWAYGSTERTMEHNRKPRTNCGSTEKLISDKKKNMPKS